MIECELKLQLSVCEVDRFPRESYLVGVLVLYRYYNELEVVDHRSILQPELFQSQICQVLPRDIRLPKSDRHQE